MPSRDSAQPLVITVLDGVSGLPASAWDAIVDHDDPFLEHAFLSALERSGSVGPGTGWEPRILVAHRGEQLAGAVPLYLKHDSMAEFIWDFSWAYGARSAGLPYYPKLVAAIPFTPVTSHRLLVHPGEARAAIVPALVAGLYRVADETSASSVHVLFCRSEEVDELALAGFLPRASFQFHWTNRRPEPYRDFEDFLASYRSRARKQVRYERKVANQQGLKLVVARGTELDDQAWAALDRCYRATVYDHGNVDFLTPDFFARIRENHASRLIASLAYRDGRPVAAATSFTRGGRLCGRYWGSDVRLSMLHFEICYYRLIEYAIAHHLARFEGGAGGDQKVKRGLLPRRTYSAHWIRHPGLGRAVAEYVRREAIAVEEEMRICREASPFANNQAPSSRRSDVAAG